MGGSVSAFIDTRPSDIAAAIDRAAQLLAAARLPLVAGLGTDVDGVRAALRLAATAGAAIDHAAASHLDVDLRVLADAGAMTTTPAEARHRADLVVLVGAHAVAAARDARVFEAGDLYPWRGDRHVLAVGVPAEDLAGFPAEGLSQLGVLPSNATKLLGLARARLAGRAVAPGLPMAEVDAAVERLKAAHYVVVIYDGAELGALGAELVQGLVKDLNLVTRATTLPAPAPYQGRAANLVSAWTTGGPLRVGFGRGYPAFDPWAYDADRLVASGEADAVVWVAPLGPDLPAWEGRRPTVALVAPGTNVDADVVIEVGVPGVHHGTSVIDDLRDGFAWIEPSAPADLPDTDLPTAAAVLDGIAARLAPHRRGGHA
jgi:formylmethanofuran dehydrogenase subunit B